MLLREWLGRGVVILAVVAACGCGGGGGEEEEIVALGAESLDATTPAIVTSIANLPQVTAPVVSDLAAPTTSLAAKGALRGVPLSSFSDDSVSEASSVGMCHQMQMLQRVMAAATTADQLACYMKHTVDDIAYDGSLERIRLNMSGIDPAHPDELIDETFLVEVVANQRENNGELASLVLRVCDSGTQSQFIEYSVDADVVNMRTKRSSEFGDESETHVVGVLNEDGDFVSKSVELSYATSGEGVVGYGASRMTQGADAIALDGWEVGTFHGDQQYSRVSSGVAELLHGDDMSKLALGDGVSVGEERGTEFDQSAYQEFWSEGWLGDSTQSMTRELSHLANHEALREVPDVGSAPNIRFVGSERADCSANAQRVIEIDLANIADVCGDLYVDWEWFSCHDVITNGNPANSGPGGEGDGGDEFGEEEGGGEGGMGSPE